MFSNAKWARFVGERGRPGMEGPPPDELHVVPANFTHLQPWPVPSQATLANQPGGTFGSSLSIAVNPAANIAADSNFGQLPRDGPSQVFAAAGPPLDTTLYFFAPGVYHYKGWVKSTSVTFTAGTTINLIFAGRGSTGSAAGLFIPLPGAAGPLREAMFPGTSIQLFMPFEARIAIPGPWAAWWYNPLILGTADTLVAHVDIWAEYLFDEAGST